MIAGSVPAYRLQQGKRADQVGVNKRFWVRQGVIVMGFCGVMDDCIRLRYELVSEFTVCNIANHKVKSGAVKTTKRGFIGGIGHFIEYCNSVFSIIQ